MSYLSPEYRAYIKSEAWREVREQKLDEVAALSDDGRPFCEHCGAHNAWPDIWLEVNHLHYETLGFESMEDLEVLCAGPMSNRCHERADHARKHGLPHPAHIFPITPVRVRRSWWRWLFA